MQRLKLVPITKAHGNAYIGKHHRHSLPVRQAQLWAAVSNGEAVCGVACAGRPNAVAHCQPGVIEILRVCTDGTRNACSMLYSALCRAARALGYTRVITYTKEDEGGASLRASGFAPTGTTEARAWNTAKARKAIKRLWESGPEAAPRIRWERELC